MLKYHWTRKEEKQQKQMSMNLDTFYIYNKYKAIMPISVEWLTQEKAQRIFSSECDKK
jgi:hypothetical protein